MSPRPYRIAPALAVLALLGACEKAPDKTKPRPGLWEWTTTIRISDIQGFPDAMAAQLRDRQPPAPPPEAECITPEQAAQDLSKLTAIRDDKSCTFSDIKTAPGSLTGTAQCGRPGEPLQGKGKVAATVAWEKMEVNLDMTTSMAVPGQSTPGTARMLVTRTGKRLGECPAGKS